MRYFNSFLLVSVNCVKTTPGIPLSFIFWFKRDKIAEHYVFHISSIIYKSNIFIFSYMSYVK